MSKMDGLRAMREAKYAKAAAAKPVATPKPVAARAPKAAQAETPPPGAAATDGRLCGHRAISGRTCTREHGHAAKSHRYA